MIKHLLSFLFIFYMLACAGNRNTGAIQDCPEEKIVNKMPVVGEPTLPREYFIYKGERRELAEFDTAWVRRNCNVKVTEAY